MKCNKRAKKENDQKTFEPKNKKKEKSYDFYTHKKIIINKYSKVKIL